MIGQLVLGLSILVGVHEWGHLITAKYFGMKVEKYSIGFPPKIWSKKIGETEYSIGAIPLGGFVKIAGMIDESLDVKKLKAVPEPYEFRAKPAWQRLIVMMGGIIVNLILGVIIFIGLALVNGETYLSKETLNKHGIVTYELGEQLGFKTGDKILSVNGNDYERFSDLFSGDVLLSSDSYYTVSRNGKEIKIYLPNDFIEKISKDGIKNLIIAPRTPFSVGEVTQGSNADLAKLKMNDKIIALNGSPINYFDEFSSAMDSLENKNISLDILRNKEKMTLNVKVSEENTIGFMAENEIEYIEKEFTYGEAVSVGTSRAFSAIILNIKGFGKMFSGDIDPRKSVMGPLGIMKQFGGDWNWNRFWYLVGFLSMILAFMNFLPIPALDGGHVLFLTWEIVTGKKPSDKFLETAQKFGMIILLSLITFIIINDIINF